MGAPAAADNRCVDSRQLAFALLIKARAHPPAHTRPPSVGWLLLKNHARAPRTADRAGAGRGALEGKRRWKEKQHVGAARFF